MLPLFPLFALLLSTVSAFRMQSISVKGTLLCGNQPAKNVFVKLVDDDGFNMPDPDDNLGLTRTNENGSFLLTGSTRELSAIEPEIKIYHDCNDERTDCLRRWLIRLPDRYISEGAEPKETMDIGTLNLEIKLEKEERRCKPQ